MDEILMGYTLLKELSENELTISCLAQNKESYSPCFLKMLNLKTSALSLEAKRKILKTSWHLQSRITFSQISTAYDIVEDDQQVCIAYPYLSPERYRSLTRSDLEKECDNFLPKITFIIDLLHLHGLVHTDIKLSNFLYDTKLNKVVLIDLDLLAEKDSRPRGFIRGTEKHISPKILNNDILDKTVDYYSLGILLEEIKPEHKEHADFINELKSQAPVHPFSLLGEGLYNHQLISKEEHRMYMQGLFASYMLAKFNNLPKNIRWSQKSLISVASNVIGINHNIINFIEHSFQSKLKQFSCFKYLIQQSSIVYFGSCWSLSIPQEAYLHIMLQNKETKTSDNMTFYKSLLHRQWYYLAYLYGTELLNNKTLPLPVKCSLIKDLTQLAIMHDQLEHCLTLIDRYEASAGEITKIIEREKIYCLIIKNDIVAAHNFLDKCKLLDQKEIESFRAVIAIRSGNTDEAEHYLKKATNILTNDMYLNFQTKYYTLLYYFYKGEPEEALALGFQLANEPFRTEIESFYVANLSMLATLNYEVGTYNKVIKYSKQGIEHSQSMATFDKAKTFHIALANTYLRKLNFKKSLEHFLNTALLQTSGQNNNNIILYLLTYVNYLIRLGNYAKAHDILHSTIQSNASIVSRNIGKAYQNLIEVAWFTGNIPLAHFAHKKATLIFNKINDITSLEEVESLLMCIDSYNDNDIDIDGLCESMKSLFEKKSLYCAYRDLFVICLICIKREIALPAEILNLNIPIIEQSPFIKMVANFYKILAEQPNDVTHISILKTIIPTLRNQKEYFYYAIALELIALEYKRDEEYELSQKYYELALNAYDKINNLTRVRELEQINSNFPKNRTKSDNIAIIEEITTLLTSVENLSDCNQKVLYLALKLTRAERAVLLVRSIEDCTLRVKAAINCDQASLKEIEDYSSTITNQAYLEDEMYIIDNALEDERLSHYKSIIKHNILSVLAIPLKKGNDVLGVLYLDHHLIPALFQHDDIIFTKTLANLFAIIISASTIMQNYQVKNRELIEDLQTLQGRPTFITEDRELIRLFDQLPRFAQSKASILLLGESGTGKEILANMIHDLSNRKDKPLVKVNAAAIPEKLIEAELFGIADKVATDVKGRMGKFEAADGGTLFIDEIGDLPLEVQAKILRAIEYQEIERVGLKKPIHTDIRFIYATNKNLQDMVEKQLFREDLYYRINTIPIHIPPLRERKQDIPLLITTFLKTFREQGNPISLSPDVIALFQAYRWPGNVRELKHIIERLVLFAQGHSVTLENLPLDIKTNMLNNTKINPQELEKHNILEALKRNNGNQSKTARELKIPLTTLRRKIDSW